MWHLSFAFLFVGSIQDWAAKRKVCVAYMPRGGRIGIIVNSLNGMSDVQGNLCWLGSSSSWLKDAGGPLTCNAKQTG